MIPSVKILALRVDFRVFTEVRMLSSFLRCFPNVDTLHVEVAKHKIMQLFWHIHHIWHCASIIALFTDFAVCYD